MTRKASIDIGTNSTRLLIADISDAGIIFPIHHQERITRLGSGIDSSGQLVLPAMERVIQVLQEYRTIGEEMGASSFTVFATSATREARNRNTFLTLIRERSGFSCQILSGEEEARLSFLGCISDMETQKQVLVCDIGGGSTEFVFGKKQEMIMAKSLKIGSRRMHSTFLHSDPVSAEEVKSLRMYLHDNLHTELTHFPASISMCVCVGGTATTLATMDAGLAFSQAEKAPKYLLPKNSLESLIRNLAGKSIEERKNLIGLNPDRADVILAGAMIVQAILLRFGCSHTQISFRDLLFGVLID